MDVSISSTEVVGMDHLYHWTHLRSSNSWFDIHQDADVKCLLKNKPCGSLDAPWGDSISLFTIMCSWLTLLLGQ